MPAFAQFCSNISATSLRNRSCLRRGDFGSAKDRARSCIRKQLNKHHQCVRVACISGAVYEQWLVACELEIADL